MKTLLLSLVGIAGLTLSADAQILGPQTARNVLVGSVAGAIIGENNDHRALEGAAIGATAGLVWSALTAPPRQPAYAPPVPDAPRVVYAPAYTSQPVWVAQTPQLVCAPHAPVIVRRAPTVIYVAPAPEHPYYGHGHRHHYQERGHGRRHHHWR